jgi:hypothetical protein
MGLFRNVEWRSWRHVLVANEAYIRDGVKHLVGGYVSQADLAVLIKALHGPHWGEAGFAVFRAARLLNDLEGPEDDAAGLKLLASVVRSEPER